MILINKYSTQLKNKINKKNQTKVYHNKTS
jgi:hypothetical protein